MRAVYISSFGGFEGLQLLEIADPPAPGPGQVLVRVRAAGLNRADLLQLRGAYGPPQGYSPNRPGLEFAGEISAVGDGEHDLNIGDRVFGITAGEAQAEYVLIDGSLLAPVPAVLDMVDAAAVPEAFITAHDAMFTQAELKSGECLLIHAVGSGVGLAALQLAKANGVNVIGTSRTESKLGRCTELGLDNGIATGGSHDFSTQVKEITNGKGADVILDLVGAKYFAQNLASLALKGRLMLVGLTSGSSAEFDMGIALHKRARIVGTVLRPRSVEEKAVAVSQFVNDVLPLFATGKLKANVDKVFSCEDARSAYRHLASNDTFGKVLITF